MKAPRQTEPRTGNGAMRTWVAGIAVVILVAFVLAVGWNNTMQTADNAPPATMGSGGATMPPSTTGSGTTGSAPAMAPSQPATPAPMTGTK